tara:strand:+ start:6955 stop:7164 length:210 start_codon:yes stop_codon:yes gene_type:complete
MSKISFELLESEWIKYNGYKNFLKFKEKSFGDDINQKFLFKDDKLLELNDYDAYNYVKENYTIKTKDMK